MRLSSSGHGNNYSALARRRRVVVAVSVQALGGECCVATTGEKPQQGAAQFVGWMTLFSSTVMPHGGSVKRDPPYLLFSFENKNEYFLKVKTKKSRICA